MLFSPKTTFALKVCLPGRLPKPSLSGLITVWLCVNTGVARQARDSASIKCVNYRAHQHKGASDEQETSNDRSITSCAVIPFNFLSRGEMCDKRDGNWMWKNFVFNNALSCAAMARRVLHCTHLVCDKFRCMLFRDSSPRESLWNHNMSKHEKKLKLFFSQPMYTEDYSQIFSSFDQRRTKHAEEPVGEQTLFGIVTLLEIFRPTAGLTELNRETKGLKKHFTFCFMFSGALTSHPAPPSSPAINPVQKANVLWFLLLFQQGFWRT